MLDDDSVPDLPVATTASVVGIAVAVVGNVLISLALNCQKLAHRRLELELKAKTQHSSSIRTLEYEEDMDETVSEDSEERTRVEHEPDSGMYNAEIDSRPAETDPLLRPREYTPPSYNSFDSLPAKRLQLLARLFPFNRITLRKPMLVTDGADATHTVIPVEIDVQTTAGSHATENSSASDAKGNTESGYTEGNYLSSKLWWLGFVLMNVGELGNFISYAFAPASVVAPLGTFALIANCFFAPLMLGERFRKRDLLGVAIAIIGAITVVLSSKSSDIRLSPKALILAISQTPFIVYSTIYIVGALILSSFSESRWGKEWVFVDVGLCALFGGFTVLSTKGLSSILTLKWIEMFTEWITYPLLLVLVGTGVGQIKYLNRALMKFDSKLVIPTQFVLFNLSAIVGSAILYGDFQNTTFHQMITFLYGCAATFAGVFLIAWSPPSPEEEEEGEETGDILSGSASSSPDNGPRNRRALSSLTNAVLVVPNHSKATPILRTRASAVSLGLSPGQRLLLVHTPPREGGGRRQSHVYFRDVERDPASVSNAFTRRRAISWMGDHPPDSNLRTRECDQDSNGASSPLGRHGSPN